MRNYFPINLEVGKSLSSFSLRFIRGGNTRAESKMTRRLINELLWSGDMEQDLKIQLIVDYPKGLRDMTTSLTGWWLHVKTLQQRGLGGAFIFLQRLFSLCVPWKTSPLGRNEAMCWSLSPKAPCSRQVAIQGPVFKGHRRPVTPHLGKGNI